jgi:NMD protein affecting ribosome stability and mRNA decay
MNTEDRRVCPSCGKEFSGAMEFCPVCMLRKALAESGVESSACSSEGAVRPAPERTTRLDNAKPESQSVWYVCELGG